MAFGTGAPFSWRELPLAERFLDAGKLLAVTLDESLGAELVEKIFAARLGARGGVGFFVVRGAPRLQGDQQLVLLDEAFERDRLVRLVPRAAPRQHFEAEAPRAIRFDALHGDDTQVVDH